MPSQVYTLYSGACVSASVINVSSPTAAAGDEDDMGAHAPEDETETLEATAESKTDGIHGSCVIAAGAGLVGPFCAYIDPKDPGKFVGDKTCEGPDVVLPMAGRLLVGNSGRSHPPFISSSSSGGGGGGGCRTFTAFPSNGGLIGGGGLT